MSCFYQNFLKLYKPPIVGQVSSDILFLLKRLGWSGHPVCGKRYHFIIKADGNSIGGYHKPCMCCGDVVHIYESKWGLEIFFSINAFISDNLI